MAAPVVQTGAGNVTTAVAHTATNQITVSKPANVAVGDLLVAWIASQNNSNTTPPTSSGWTRPTGTPYNVTGDAGRRPSGLFFLRVTDSTVLAGLPSSWTWAGPTGTGRWGGGIARITGADLSVDPATYVTGAYNTDSTLAAVARALPGLTVPADDHLLLVGASAQMNAVATPTAVTWSGSLSEAFDICSIASGSVAHQTMSLAFEEADTGATGTRTATFAANPASASGYMVAVPSGTPPTPTSTSTRVIAHRATLAIAADSTENSVAGLDILAALRRPVNGVEIDARLPSDWATTRVAFLQHDPTGARTHPAMGATGVEGYTTAQLDTFGVTRLSTFLAAVPGRHLERINVQHYTPANVSQIGVILELIAASPVADRCKLMTSISSPYAPAEIRTAGWTGPLGTYGSTAANYAGAGDGQASDFTASSIGWAYLPPGGYTANRSHAQALVAGGTIKVGASTENTSTVWAQAHADGVDEVLTDNADDWLALYEPPFFANPLEQLGAGDSATVAIARPGSQTDPLGSSDTATVALERPVTAGDTVAGSDVVQVALARDVAGVDLVGASDSVTVAMQRAVVITDGVGGLDTALAATSRAVSVTDGVGASDGATSPLSRLLEAVEALGLVDAAAATSSRSVDVVEPAGLTDAATGSTTGAGAAAANDGLGAGDVVDVAMSRVATAQDALAGSDTAAAVMARGATVLDGVGVVDQVLVALARSIEISDGAVVVDQAAGEISDGPPLELGELVVDLVEAREHTLDLITAELEEGDVRTRIIRIPRGNQRLLDPQPHVDGVPVTDYEVQATRAGAAKDPGAWSAPTDDGDARGYLTTETLVGRYSVHVRYTVGAESVEEIAGQFDIT